MKLRVANETDRLIDGIVEDGLSKESGRDLIRAFKSLANKVDRIVARAERELRKV